MVISGPEVERGLTPQVVDFTGLKINPHNYLRSRF